MRCTCDQVVLGARGLLRLAFPVRERGVAFEHYDMPGINWDGDVMVAGPMKAAWFKDPDGNILCMMNG